MSEYITANTNASRVLKGFISNRWLNKKDKTLVVCGDVFDDQLLNSLGFKNYLITSMYSKKNKKVASIKNYQKQDAQNLSYKDESFDTVIAHAGLHHCASPHQALLEMYRVAKKNVIFFESQDSPLMRLLGKLGISADYELDAVENRDYGGVDNKPIPNYVYRWTKKEVEKTIRSYDAKAAPIIHYQSNFVFHSCFLDNNRFLSKNPITKILSKHGFDFFTKILNLFLKDQGNNFIVIIRKNKRIIHPWIKQK